MAAFKAELDDMSNSDTVKVTLYDEEPNKILLRGGEKRGRES